MVGVGLQPFLTAKAGLEGSEPVVVAQAQPLRQQPRGLVAFTEVGVAIKQVFFRHTVVAEDQLVRRTVFGTKRLDVVGHGLDVGRIIRVVADKPQVRQPAPLHEVLGNGVKGGGIGGRGILRVQGQHHQLAHPRLLHGLQLAGDGRIPVTHGKADVDVVTEFVLQPLADASTLGLGVHHQRRARLRPDAFVSMGRTGRADHQNHQVENEEPDQAGDFHHPRIGEEFTQIAAQGAGLRRIRGPQVGDQHPQLLRLAVIKVLLSLISHPFLAAITLSDQYGR